MWDAEGFAGTIGLRGTADGGPLPPPVPGHVGYSVVPWRRRRGCATGALGAALAERFDQGAACGHAAGPRYRVTLA